MIPKFRPIDIDRHGDVRVLEKWLNDVDLRAISSWNEDEQDLYRPLSKEEIIHRYRDMKENGKNCFFVLDKTTPIGEYSWETDPPCLLAKVSGTAWISIIIAEPEYRGRGLGKSVMEHIERSLVERGLRRVELGVFCFNSTAIRFYRRMGYREIGRIPGFTFFDGRMHDDIRMEKWL